MEGRVARQDRSQLLSEFASVLRRQQCDKAADAWAHKRYGRQALNELVEGDAPAHGPTDHQYVQQGLMSEGQVSIVGLLQYVETMQPPLNVLRGVEALMRNRQTA